MIIKEQSLSFQGMRNKEYSIHDYLHDLVTKAEKIQIH